MAKMAPTGRSTALPRVRLAPRPPKARCGADQAAGEGRTPDLLITNQPLYRLSYGGAHGAWKSVP